MKQVRSFSYRCFEKVYIHLLGSITAAKDYTQAEAQSELKKMRFLRNSIIKTLELINSKADESDKAFKEIALLNWDLYNDLEIILKKKAYRNAVKKHDNTDFIHCLSAKSKEAITQVLIKYENKTETNS